MCLPKKIYVDTKTGCTAIAGSKTNAFIKMQAACRNRNTEGPDKTNITCLRLVKPDEI